MRLLFDLAAVSAALASDTGFALVSDGFGAGASFGAGLESPEGRAAFAGSLLVASLLVASLLLGSLLFVPGSTFGFSVSVAGRSGGGATGTWPGSGTGGSERRGVNG